MPRERAIEARLEREKKIRDLGKLFTAPLGKEVLEFLNDEFYNTISYSPGDSHFTAFNEGHRDVVQFINNAVKAVKEG